MALIKIEIDNQSMLLHSSKKIMKTSFLGLTSSALLRIASFNFTGRHSKDRHHTGQKKHWHVSETQSIVKDLEIIYRGPENEGDEEHALLMNSSLNSLEEHKKILEDKFKEFKAYLLQNMKQIDELLSQIQLTASVIIQSLDDVFESIERFSKNPQSMSLHQVHAKSKVLEFVFRQIFQARSQESLFHKVAYIIEVQIKLKSAFTYFDLYSSAERNITNSHPSLFPEVWKHIQIQTFDDPQAIQKKYKEIQEVLHATGGAIEKSSKSGNSMVEKIMFGIRLPINFIQYEWGLLNSLMFYRNAKLQNYQKFLNLYEDGLIKLFTTHYYFPKITTNTVIYIPPEGDFPQDLDIFKQNKEYISVRVLYHKALPIIEKQKSKKGQQIEDIIVHMHGGGFVGLSSHTTQNYTRPWANELKMPLFSIDYRMPPTHPFPHAPNDCLQVYKFLVNCLSKYMRIRPKNVYICGDSAGGNLSCSLTALVMKNGLLKPKGLFLAYPCVDTRMIYYPSRKYIINDPILWPSIALMFFNSYTNKTQRNDPIASPLLLTDQFVGGTVGETKFPLSWPMTYITLGNKDPLRDQTLLLMQKMVESNIPCKCYLFEHLRHAFFSTERIMKQSNEAFNHSIEAFKELVKLSKQEHL